jgi:hypothetical protein
MEKLETLATLDTQDTGQINVRKNQRVMTDGESRFFITTTKQLSFQFPSQFCTHQDINDKFRQRTNHGKQFYDFNSYSHSIIVL